MDLEMCTGEWCPIKERCLRYTAKPSKNQRYMKPRNWCQLFLKDCRVK